MLQFSTTRRRGKVVYLDKECSLPPSPVVRHNNFKGHPLKEYEWNDLCVVHTNQLSI